MRKREEKRGRRKHNQDEAKHGEDECNDRTIGSHNDYHLSPNGIPSGN